MVLKAAFRPMEVIILLAFISLSLAGSAVWAFVYTVRHNDLDHADRLALAPMADDVAPTVGRLR
jgi:hypothetical protein